MIVSGSALLGAVAAITVSWGTITDALPFVQKTPYANDWGANDVRMQRVESDTRALSVAQMEMIKNSDLSLQIQLQTRVDALKIVMERTPPGDPERSALRATYDDLEQKLRQLNRKLAQ